MNAPFSFNERQAMGNSPDSALSLNDKYVLPSGRVYVNGAQALVRLMLLQAQRDQLAGLNTAGFVSGYRGSPLGGLDIAFQKAEPFLTPKNIHFQPGLNEDLAATSVWGSQQTNLFEGAKYQGVFSMWYGKGPGVDRSLDVFKHANAAGTSKHGGVLLVAGDDHAAKSSTLPHQSDHVLKAAMMPVLFPADLQEYLDLGVLGYAMSRYAGVWVGFKAIADTVESSSSVWVDPQRVNIQLPTDFDMPATGLNIRWPDTPLEQEARLLDEKLYAALAFARANRINYTAIDSPKARFGIVASGKAYLDTLQALRDLGLDEQLCAELGVRVYKVGMVWPLEARGIREFAQGLQEILVVEEKRQLIEYQIKEELYAWRPEVRPRVYGKYDERGSHDGREGGEWSIPQGKWLLPTHYELNPAIIAKAIARRLGCYELPAQVRLRFSQRLKDIRRAQEQAKLRHAPIDRKPHFCSGCPHNTSTKVPEGSRAMAGIGCHYMAVWMDRNTHTFTQMGGEGVPWIGQAAFTATEHVFANLGDGTYFHSGILAIRASIAAKVNITYKILFNDAVAMTGGQALDGSLSVPQLTRQLAAEGVSKIVVVTDDLIKYADSNPQDPFAEGIEVFDRSELDAVQRQLRRVKGTSVLVYEQTCAAEKRRRRKRVNAETGQPAYPDPAKRVVINPEVCEGCGDCSKQSNCLSIEPMPTPLGTKRRINQSTCNKDYTCLQGLCPSLVTVEGAQLRKSGGVGSMADLHALCDQLPPPQSPKAIASERPYGILIDGVGGTGVITLGAWLGMAAHLEGLPVKVLDMAGLAQKGGAVHSHVRLASVGGSVASAKIPAGEADLLLGADSIVSSNPQTLNLLHSQAVAVLNNDTVPTSDFISNSQWVVPIKTLQADLDSVLTSSNQIQRFNALNLAERLLGDTVYANPLLLGAAFQLGFIPLKYESIEEVIRLNNVQVEMNLLAFRLGRLLIANSNKLTQYEQSKSAAKAPPEPMPVTQQQWLTYFSDRLVAYHNQDYANRYASVLQPLLDKGLSDEVFTSLAQQYYRLLAYKDEFEVARLLSDSSWQQQTLSQYDRGARLIFHVAPTWLVKDGERRKFAIGRGAQWMFKCLAKLKWLRFTPLNPFKFSEEVKQQQELLKVFDATLLAFRQGSLGLNQLQVALDVFESVKGFGQIRQQSYNRAMQQLKQLDLNNR